MAKRLFLSNVFFFVLFVCIFLTEPFVLAKSPKMRFLKKEKEFGLSMIDPQGQTWSGKHLWIADDRTDTLYKINPSNCKEISKIPSPGPEPRGLAWDGKSLWCSDNRTKKIYELDPKNGRVISNINAPISKATNAPSDTVRGLAWDGKYLWSAYYAGWGSQISKLDPETGEILESFFPGGIPHDLACDGKYLYCANNNNFGKKTDFDDYNYVFVFNLTDCTLSSLIKIHNAYPTGLAIDGDNFWHIDKLSKKVLKAKILTH